jgi:hypothetical protein
MLSHVPQIMFGPDRCGTTDKGVCRGRGSACVCGVTAESVPPHPLIGLPDATSR